MYISVDQELSRQHREEIMHGVMAVRLESKALARVATAAPLARDLWWELARYMGLLGKPLRK